MRRYLGDMNPTLRGFLVLALIALGIVVLQLYQTLEALYVIARIAFLLAIAFFLYLVWRERREEIAAWPVRARYVLYGGALLIVADLFLFSLWGAYGLELAAFVLVLVVCGYAIFRVWRQQHTYPY